MTAIAEPTPVDHALEQLTTSLDHRWQPAGAQTLLSNMGYGTTSSGTLIPTGQLLKMANAADVIPTVLSKSGAVLDQGRSRRVATTNQTLALIAGDGVAHSPAAHIHRNGANATTSPNGSAAG